MMTDCPICENANAYVAGELPPAERADFEIHIARCATCRAAVDSTRRVIARLSSLPPVQNSRDLTPLILARLREETLEVPRRSNWPRIAAAAAVAMVFAGGFSLMRKPPVAPQEVRQAATHTVTHQDTAASSAKALDWLARTQDVDGSWNPERWGGERKFAPALCALPLLAFLSADERTGAQENAAGRATVRLIQFANSDGTFGSIFQGAPYNDSIATLALLHAWKRNPEAVPKSTLDAAIASLLRTQTADGGWGYQYSPLSDRSITQWHVQALNLADQLGWKEARPVADRGLKWLETIGVDNDESIYAIDSPSTVLARATESSSVADPLARGLYQTYFTISALRADPAAHDQVIAIEDAILRRQESSGEVSGSWSPDDQWGRAGGRIYATAMACLSIARKD